jgi:soluble lytic murein transglycosylase-like protein
MNACKIFIRSAAFGLWLSSLLIAASPADLKRLYEPVVKKAAETHHVDQELIHAVIQAESNYDRFAISDKGAMGLMQLMPATAAQYGVGNVFDAVQNVEGGTRYLKDLITLYRGQKDQKDRVLAAYNAGQDAVKKYGGIPPYQETRDFIRRVQYTKTVIRKPIYKILDATGRWVLTDDPNYNPSKKRG